MIAQTMEIYSFEEALSASAEYFGGDELAAKVFLDANALRDEKGQLLECVPTQMHRRLAKEFARIEQKKFKRPLTEEEIFGFFDNFVYIIPQSSPMTGIGNNYQVISLSNCFVCEPPLDSYGGILRTDEYIVQLSKRRGGVGTSLSNLRPNGTSTRNAAKTSSGVVGFAERYSNSIREVGQNGRRGALMLMLSIHHPESVIVPDKDDDAWKNPVKIIIKGDPAKGERDLETLSCFYNSGKLDFASMKLDRKRTTGANISIALSDEFLKAVEANKDYEQRFPVNSPNPIISKQVNARNVWKKIIHMAWQSAEPGILFWDRITKYNAVDCYADKGFATVCTNPCGEVPLCANDSCRLFAINLWSFVSDRFTQQARFNYDLFRRVVKVAQRLMDDLIDLEIEKIEGIIQKIENDPEPLGVKVVELGLWNKILVTCKQGRRTGLGFTALADMLASMGLRYDSDEAFVLVDNIMRQFKLDAYTSSCEMAEEIGPFPIWDWETEKNSEFLLQIQREDPSLYDRIARYGRRNIACLTVAPTGTPSIFARTSSGCEPVFALKYTRRKKINPGDEGFRIDFVDNQGDAWHQFDVYHPALKVWMEITKETDISKSPWYKCCANDIDWEKRVKLQGILQKHIDHSISSTVNLPFSATEADVEKIYTAAWKYGCKGITVYRDGCRSGVLVNNETESLSDIQPSAAPKRPQDMVGELHHFVIDGRKYYVAVGLYGRNRKPYEVFTGLNETRKEIFIPKTIRHGKISKRSRGQYVFICDEGEEYELTNGHSNDTADALTRIISTALRHGTDIAFIVHQLEKTKGPIICFSRALARTLKKYIQDGTKIYGEECPSCGGKLVRKEGCVACSQCGYSKCS